MTAYPGQTLTTLGQLCTTLWDSQSRPVVIQPGIEPGSIVMPIALRCSAIDHCASREPINVDATMITHNPEWIVTNDEWERGSKTIPPRHANLIANWCISIKQYNFPLFFEHTVFLSIWMIYFTQLSLLIFIKGVNFRPHSVPIYTQHPITCFQIFFKHVL
jgi:hypothetical protein